MQGNRRLILGVIALLLGVALVVGPRVLRIGDPSDGSSAGSASSVPSQSPTAETPLPSGEPTSATLLAVGDIGYCAGSADEAVAELAASLSGAIALLGDIAYPDGSAADFANCFDPAWGTLRDRVRPAPGNHEYQTTDADGYFTYFGSAAGTPGEGWYSYELGAWHVIALNSECDAIGGCGPGSSQLAWLTADLGAHPTACTLAYWHHPRFSSGHHGDDVQTDPLWQALADAGAELVLSGHDHDYERFAPSDGVRQFVVGTGGRSLYAWPGEPEPGTEIRDNSTYGLLQLQLTETGYAWEFLPAANGTFTDTGRAPCAPNTRQR